MKKVYWVLLIISILFTWSYSFSGDTLNTYFLDTYITVKSLPDSAIVRGVWVRFDYYWDRAGNYPDYHDTLIYSEKVKVDSNGVAVSKADWKYSIHVSVSKDSIIKKVGDNSPVYLVGSAPDFEIWWYTKMWRFKVLYTSLSTDFLSGVVKKQDGSFVGDAYIYLNDSFVPYSGSSFFDGKFQISAPFNFRGTLKVKKTGCFFQPESIKYNGLIKDDTGLVFTQIDYTPPPPGKRNPHFVNKYQEVNVSSTEEKIFAPAINLDSITTSPTVTALSGINTWVIFGGGELFIRGYDAPTSYPVIDTVKIEMSVGGYKDTTTIKITVYHAIEIINVNERLMDKNVISFKCYDILGKRIDERNKNKAYFVIFKNRNEKTVKRFIDVK